MSGILTYLTQAVVRDNVKELDGKTLTRPTLLISDGEHQTFGVDVDIAQKRIGKRKNTETNLYEEYPEGEVVPLRNVPIASGTHQLIYADIGSAVRLRRSESGFWEIVGFSKRAPGTYTVLRVTIGKPSCDPLEYTIGDPTSIGLSSRALTYEELSTYGDYGTIPYGAIGVFRGGTLIEIRS